MDDAQEIRALELRLLEPGVRGSRAAVEEILAEEFVEFGSSGRRFDRNQMIEALRVEGDVRYSLEDFRTRPIGPDAVLATYRAEIRSGSSLRRSLRSSVWCRRGGRWRLVFHQGTPTEDGRA